MKITQPTIKLIVAVHEGAILISVCKDKCLVGSG